MQHSEITLNQGILKACFKKVRQNFYDRIDADKHAEVYRGVHDRPYAEPEFTGKFLDICAYYYENEHDPRALEKGMKVIRSIAEHQREDGYLGCLHPGMELVAFSVWNHGFTLYGITRMYEATKDPMILSLAQKAADWILNTYRSVQSPDILEASNAGSQNISCLYAMGRLHIATGDHRYLDFIKNVLDYCETTDMNLLSFDSIFSLRSQKGIEMLVIYLGVLQYGRLTNDQRAIDAAKRYWDQIYTSQIRNTGNGTVVEKWTPNGNAARLMPTEDKPNETCVAVGWTELSLALFDTEPNASYLDAIEQTLFNHLLGSLEKNGEDFAYYQGNFGKKIYRTDDGAYQCCRYRGFTIFSYLKEYLYHMEGNCITPLVYCPSRLDRNGLSITQTTTYPTDGLIRFSVENNGNSEKSLRLRIPKWCNAYVLKLNGRNLDEKPTQGFITIPLPMGKTEITLELAMECVSEEHTIEDRSYLSFHYGPLLLAHDTHFGAPLWTPVSADKTGERIPAQGLSNVRFRYDGLDLVDFASAGGNCPAEDEYTVFIPRK